jgi:hypothetical protein
LRLSFRTLGKGTAGTKTIRETILSRSDLF